MTVEQKSVQTIHQRRCLIGFIVWISSCLLHGGRPNHCSWLAPGVVRAETYISEVPGFVKRTDADKAAGKRSVNRREQRRAGVVHEDLNRSGLCVARNADVMPVAVGKGGV